MANPDETAEPPAENLTVGDGPPPARFGESTWLDYWYDVSEKPDGTRVAKTFAYGMQIDVQTCAPVGGQPVPWAQVLAPTLAKIQDDADTYGIAP